MLSLSIQQPWAWLIVNGYKNVENRTWKTNVRGPVNIHAGKTFDHEGYEYVCQEFPQIQMPEPRGFDLGGIVGVADIADCVRRMDSPWFFGPFGFVVKNAYPVPFEPCRGRLGFFKAEDSRSSQLAMKLF